MDHSQYVSVGGRSVVKLRYRQSAIANDQQNWCLHSTRHRKNGKRDFNKVSNIKSKLLIEFKNCLKDSHAIKIEYAITLSYTEILYFLVIQITIISLTI